MWKKIKHDRNVHQMAKSEDSNCAGDWGRHKISKMMQFVHVELDIETLLWLLFRPMFLL